ncbi:MAG TPA: hypothetical protein VIV58_00575, partial [Kofleriaceae bacterium]
LEAAEPLLVLAATSSDPEAAASARVFLGLIADARGESGRARSYYRMVASSPTALGVTGRALLASAGDRWSIAVVSRPGYDSNVALQPATVTATGAGGDADLTTIGAITTRPLSDLDLVLDNTVLYRRHARMTDFDMLSDTVGASAIVGGATDRAILAYHFDAATLGGARYDVGHAVDLGYVHVLAGPLAATARYSLDARTYTPAAYAGYTGLTHTGILELAWGTPTSAKQASLGYVIERDATDDPMLAATGNGARLALRTGSSAIELRGSALASYRIYDADALGRRDLLVTADTSLYAELSHAFGLVVGATLLRNLSNEAATDYLKWTVYAGVVASAGS